jgi:hypothetical protein
LRIVGLRGVCAVVVGGEGGGKGGKGSSSFVVDGQKWVDEWSFKSSLLGFGAAPQTRAKVR